MILHRVTVFGVYEPIKFWMTEEQVRYFRGYLIGSNESLTISRSNYEILTGVTE